jgi:hypothetical protein
MQATRRRFFAWMGATPLAAKAAADAEIGRLAAMRNTNGLGDASISIDDGDFHVGGRSNYQERTAGAAEYIKVFGVPEAVETKLRNDAKYVHSLDPDIACMRSWSMSFKIHCQRQRNYERSLQEITTNAKHARAKKMLKSLIGFEWPW